MRSIATIVLAAWFVLVFFLGAHGTFTTPPGQPPLTLLFGVATPLVVFFLAYRLPAFHAFVYDADLRLGAGIQAWRAGGLGFLALYAYGVLPGAFAWPAGLGDIAIGVTAPWIVRALIHRPAFASSRTFVVWNLLGILDLVVAVSVGAASSAFATGAAGEVTTAPMTHLPLVLIPCYLVPLFIMLHAAALFQAKQKL